MLVVLQMENSYNGLLMAIDPHLDEDLLPPEAFIPAGPITPEGEPLIWLACTLFSKCQLKWKQQTVLPQIGLAQNLQCPIHVTLPLSNLGSASFEL